MTGSHYDQTQRVFLQFMLWIYFCAFLSWAVQIDGLYANDGGVIEIDLSHDRSRVLPLLMSVLSIEKDVALQLVAFSGVLLSLLGLVFGASSVLLGLLWLFYLTVVCVGGAFSHFQWDILLLEAGFIALFFGEYIVAPPIDRRVAQSLNLGRVVDRPSATVMFLVRWLLFRLMFASGLVKLLSRGSEWWQCTALAVHYETTCIPHLGSYWAFQLSRNWHIASCCIMFVVELLLPWFIFVPTRWLRVVNGAGQLALQIAIMATGNYNFFNFLTSALAIALLDNSAFDSRLRRQRTSWSRSISNGISVVVLLAVLAGAATFVANRAHWWNFDTLSRHLATLVRTSVLLGWLWLGLSFAQDVWAWNFRRGVSPTRRIWSLLKTLAVGLLGATLFVQSTVPYVWRLDRTVLSDIPAKQFGIDVYQRYGAPYFITSSYGLFASLTTHRDEILFEGLSDDGKTWLMYELPYQANNVSSSPSFVLPSQPRLDWQMWFAALGSHKPWLLHLVGQLLQQNSTGPVSSLFSVFPFVHQPPDRLRVTIRRYFFTDFRNSSAYWRAEAPRPWFGKESVALADLHEPARFSPTRSRFLVSLGGAFWRNVSIWCPWLVAL